jgi:hypothetical protein
VHQNAGALAEAYFGRCYDIVRRIDTCDWSPEVPDHGMDHAVAAVANNHSHCRNTVDPGIPLGSTGFDPEPGPAIVHCDHIPLAQAQAQELNWGRTRCGLWDVHCTADCPDCMNPGFVHSLAIASDHSFDRTDMVAGPELGLVAIVDDSDYWP